MAAKLEKLKCPNLVTTRVTKAGNNVVNRRKSIYAWWAKETPPPWTTIPDGYERCNGNLSVEVKISRGMYRDDEEIEVVLKCDRCGTPFLRGPNSGDFNLDDPELLNTLIAKGIDSMASKWNQKKRKKKK